MNKYDKNMIHLNLEKYMVYVSIIGFVVVASIILYNCCTYGVGGTCITGF